jgi:Family of unknown function (DUF6932)
VPLPPFTAHGDLPPGIYHATLAEVLERFGSGSPQRMLVGLRLERIYNVAWATGCLARCVIFGSFVTAKPLPNDVDVFLLMEDTFDVSQLTGEAQLLFEHAMAQTRFGASVFWLRRLAVLEDEQTTLSHWQITREGYHRGIVEITPELP